MDMFAYFKPYKNYFWKWEEAGEVVAIAEGNTIAYRGYLLELLEHVSENGLPPFGSLLLTLAATNTNGKEDITAISSLMETLLDTANQTREPLTSAVAFLRLLAALPSNYKKGKNRILVIATLFKDCHNHRSAQFSKTLLKHFEVTPVVGSSYLSSGNFYINLYHEEFRVIKLLGEKYPNVESLLNALASLPLVEEELPLEKSDDAAGEKTFVQTLIENDKTFYVGGLVQRLWSGLNIPHHNNFPSRQPLGGVSDITNKGELHRLLISEFANDDVVFLSRLANSEALYLNREVPPQKTELERIVLIDISLKNWGTPRTIAFALLLAIAKHPKTDIACTAYAVGGGVYPLQFDTVDDVIEGLQQLSANLHPAQGLNDFFKAVSVKKNKEVFFISAAESYRHPALHKIISDNYTSFTYWLHTDADGGVDLYKRQQNTKRHVQHLQLPLEELWKREVKKRKDKKQNISEQQQYPILFPAASNPRNTMVTEKGEVYLITSEWSLIKLIMGDASTYRGWEMVYDGLPHFNGRAEIGVDEQGGQTLLLYNLSNQKLTLFDVETQHKHSINFPTVIAFEAGRFIFYQHAFIYHNASRPQQFWSFSLEDEGVVHRNFESSPLTLEHQFTKIKIARDSFYLPSFLNSTVFKNIKHVFINQVGNLVLNRYELRLNSQQDITLEQSEFLQKKIEASSAGRSGFRFSDGSTAFVNRSGMLILKSSDPELPSIYIPLVVNSTLAAATQTAFAGNGYYQRPDSTSDVISTSAFWKTFMDPFIEIISNDGA